MSKFDFESWKASAAADSAGFETRRRQALLDQVAKAPAGLQPKLRELVDTLCADVSGTPLERAVRAQNVMLSSMVDLQRAAVRLVEAVGETAPPGPDSLAEFTRLVVIRKD